MSQAGFPAVGDQGSCVSWCPRRSCPKETHSIWGRGQRTLTKKKGGLLEPRSLQEHIMIWLSWCTLCLSLWGALSARKRNYSSPTANPRDEACDELLTWQQHSRTKILLWAWARDGAGWCMAATHPCHLPSPGQKRNGVSTESTTTNQCSVCDNTPYHWPHS